MGLSIKQPQAYLELPSISQYHSHQVGNSVFSRDFQNEKFQPRGPTASSGPQATQLGLLNAPQSFFSGIFNVFGIYQSAHVITNAVNTENNFRNIQKHQSKQVVTHPAACVLSQQARDVRHEQWFNLIVPGLLHGIDSVIGLLIQVNLWAHMALGVVMGIGFSIFSPALFSFIALLLSARYLWERRCNQVTLTKAKIYHLPHEQKSVQNYQKAFADYLRLQIKQQTRAGGVWLLAAAVGVAVAVLTGLLVAFPFSGLVLGTVVFIAVSVAMLCSAKINFQKLVLIGPHFENEKLFKCIQTRSAVFAAVVAQQALAEQTVQEVYYQSTKLTKLKWLLGCYFWPSINRTMQHSLNRLYRAAQQGQPAAITQRQQLQESFCRKAILWCKHEVEMLAAFQQIEEEQNQKEKIAYLNNLATRCQQLLEEGEIAFISLNNNEISDWDRLRIELIYCVGLLPTVKNKRDIANFFTPQPAAQQRFGGYEQGLYFNTKYLDKMVACCQSNLDGTFAKIFFDPERLNHEIDYLFSTERVLLNKVPQA